MKNVVFKDVVILRIDGEADLFGQSFAINSEVKIPTELPVYCSVPMQYVAIAKNVKRIDSVVVADIHVYNECKIPIEVLRHLKPCISGFCKSQNKVVEQAEIKSIDLTPYNADKRIESLVNYTFVWMEE
jgi:hypothetical protein